MRVLPTPWQIHDTKFFEVQSSRYSSIKARAKAVTRRGSSTTYHEVKRTMAMDLIADMERAAPSLAHSSLSLSCRLKIPCNVRILWVFKKLIGSEVSRAPRLGELVRPSKNSTSQRGDSARSRARLCSHVHEYAFEG